MKIEELIPYINNPKDNENAIDAVVSSIKNFGFKVLIVIDSNNEIGYIVKSLSEDERKTFELLTHIEPFNSKKFDLLNHQPNENSTH